MAPALTDEESEVDELQPDTPRRNHPRWTTMREPTGSPVTTGIRKVQATTRKTSTRDRTGDRTHNDYRKLRAKARYLSIIGWNNEKISSELGLRLLSVVNATSGKHKDKVEDDEKHVEDTFRTKHDPQPIPTTPRHRNDLARIVMAGPPSIASKRVRDSEGRKMSTRSKRARRADVAMTPSTKLPMMKIPAALQPPESGQSDCGVVSASSQERDTTPNDIPILTPRSPTDMPNAAVVPVVTEAVSQNEPLAVPATSLEKDALKTKKREKKKKRWERRQEKRLKLAEMETQTDSPESSAPACIETPLAYSLDSETQSPSSTDRGRGSSESVANAGNLDGSSTKIVHASHRVVGSFGGHGITVVVPREMAMKGFRMTIEPFV